MDNGGQHRKGVSDKKQREVKMEEQIEKVVRTLGNSSTPEQKIAILAKNVVDLEREQLRQAASYKQNEKHFDAVVREKEHLQKEYNKGVLMRDKLEQVCREQQKLMKSIKSESMSKIREEEEKRKETQAHFQQSINEIFVTLGKNNDENTKLKEANLEMTRKFKYLAEQYEIREKQLEKINEQINLETQLNEAKLAKAKMEATIEKEILLKDKEATLHDLMSTKNSIIDMQSREKILKDQLSLYTEKYEDFQSSLQKSSDIFITYKSEIEKMSKRIKVLEKESHEWRIKYEKSNRAILEMATDKQSQDQYVGKAARQLAQLQKLCRTLQAERGVLLEVLKTNNIERPEMPELPAEPTDIEPPPKTADKLDIMSRNCSELKKSLAQLQAQMNGLNNAEKEKPAIVEASVPASAAVSANKKAKNKKNKAKPSCPHKERAVHAEMVATIKSVFAPTDLEVVADTIVDSTAADPTAADSIAADSIAADSITADPIAADPAIADLTTADPPALEKISNGSESNETESMVGIANENDSPVDIVAMKGNDQDSPKQLEHIETNIEALTENFTPLVADVSVTV